MSKRGANIYKRKDGRWEARYVESISINGTKKYASVYGKSYTEAREKQIQCIQNIHLKSAKGTNITMSQLMWEWLQYASRSVKKSTYQKYESIIRNHIETAPISKIQLKYINVKIINEFSDAMIQKGNLSAKSINDILVVIGLALSYGEEVYKLPKIKIRRVKETNKEMRVLSVSEQEVLEKYLRQDINLYKFGVLLALYTGVRVGELCALRWEDIKDGTIIIDKTMHRIRDGSKTIVEVTEPKTKTSYRVIPIPSVIRALIDDFRSEGAVIKNRNGNAVEPRLMQMAFEKFISESGLPKTNFHALRHTFATRCVEAGFDIKSLSEILGHTDVRTTLNKYVHSSLELKQKNMDLLKAVVSF